MVTVVAQLESAGCTPALITHLGLCLPDSRVFVWLFNAAASLSFPS